MCCLLIRSVFLEYVYSFILDDFDGLINYVPDSESNSSQNGVILDLAEIMHLD